MRRLGLLLILLVSSSASAATTAPTTPVRTCAILSDVSLKGSPLSELVRTELESTPGLRFVERDELAKVLKEQQLAALLGADAVGPRVRLGRLLKADILVFLAKPAQASTGVQLVVCQSSTGIRLAVRTLAAPGTTSALADEASREIGLALSRVPDASAELCAVPTFVNKDLVYDFDGMKAAYAALADQSVATRAGVLTVELAEARALEREMAIAGGEIVKRPLPLYLLGEFRNDGLGVARHVSIELVLKRGETELARKGHKDLEPDKVADAIGELVDALFQGQQHAPPAADAAAVEVRQLVRRAEDFEQIGEWQEGIDLYEAALLLDPANKLARARVIRAIARVPNPNTVGKTRDQEFELMLRTHQIQRRRFEHQEAYAKRFALGLKDYDLVNFETSNIMYGDSRDPRSRPVFMETNLESRQIQLALMHQRIQDGARDSLMDLLCGQPLYLQVDGEQPSEGFARLLELVLSFKDFPNARIWALRCSGQYTPVIGYGPGGRSLYASDAEWEPYLTELEKSGSKALREAATDVRVERVQTHAAEVAYEASTKARMIPRPVVQPVPTTGPCVEMRPIDLQMIYPNNRKDKYPVHVVGWFPAGLGRDVIWSYNDLFVMTEPGVARCLWSGSERPHVEIDTACFDGRYIWTAGRRTEGRLVVIDPETAVTCLVSKTDGLLPMNSGVIIAPLGPGRVCVAAGFRPPEVGGLAVRGWCATVTLDSANKASVKVFHEAERVIRDDWTEKLSTADVGFFPTYLVAVGTGEDRRLVMGRQTEVNQYRCFTPPLVIDPQKLTVELWDQKDKLPGKRNGPWSSAAVEGNDGGLYFAEPAFVEGSIPGKSWTPRVFRATGARAQLEMIGRLPPIDFRAEGGMAGAAFYKGNLYLLGQRLFDVNPRSGAATVLPVQYPQSSTDERIHLGVSNHFGLITWRNGQGEPRKYLQDFYSIQVEK